VNVTDIDRYPITYKGWVISRGSYQGTSDDVLGRYYIDPPETDYYDRRGPGFRTLAEAKAAINESLLLRGEE
jgi:hypothetical protein